MAVGGWGAGVGCGVGAGVGTASAAGVFDPSAAAGAVTGVDCAGCGDPFPPDRRPVRIATTAIRASTASAVVRTRLPRMGPADSGARETVVASGGSRRVV